MSLQITRATVYILPAPHTLKELECTDSDLADIEEKLSRFKEGELTQTELDVAIQQWLAANKTPPEFDRDVATVVADERRRQACLRRLHTIVVEQIPTCGANEELKEMLDEARLFTLGALGKSPEWPSPVRQELAMLVLEGSFPETLCTTFVREVDGERAEDPENCACASCGSSGYTDCKLRRAAP